MEINKKADLSASGNYKTTKRLKTRKSLFTRSAYPRTNISEEIYKMSRFARRKDTTGTEEKILDIGCGFGDTLALFKKNKFIGKLTGIDLSPAMIKEARSNYGALGIGYIVMPAEKLEFPEETFDTVICQHSLYYFDMDRAVREIARVLKPGGRLVFSLNSLAGNSRKHVEEYKRVIAGVINNFNFLETSSRVNFENYYRFFPDFLILKELKLYRYIKLSEKEQFVKYMGSFREYWKPVPGDIEWHKALSIVGEMIDTEIKEKGVFEEEMSFGIGLMEKK